MAFLYRRALLSDNTIDDRDIETLECDKVVNRAIFIRVYSKNGWQLYSIFSDKLKTIHFNVTF